MPVPAMPRITIKCAEEWKIMVLRFSLKASLLYRKMVVWPKPFKNPQSETFFVLIIDKITRF